MSGSGYRQTMTPEELAAWEEEHSLAYGALCGGAEPHAIEYCDECKAIRDRFQMTPAKRCEATGYHECRHCGRREPIERTIART